MAHRADGLNDIFENSVIIRKKVSAEEGEVYSDPIEDYDIVNKKYVDDVVSTIVSSQWIASGNNIYYNIGNVGVGTNTPLESIHSYKAASNNFIEVQSDNTYIAGIKFDPFNYTVAGQKYDTIEVTTASTPTPGFFGEFAFKARGVSKPITFYTDLAGSGAVKRFTIEPDGVLMSKGNKYKIGGANYCYITDDSGLWGANSFFGTFHHAFFSHRFTNNASSPAPFLFTMTSSYDGSKYRGVYNFETSDTTTDTLSSRIYISPTKGYIGFFTTSPTEILSISGQDTRKIWMERNTTTNTAGNSLTVQAGGAKSGATDKDGGEMLLYPGVSTGTGKTATRIKRLTRAASTGTSDNTLTDAYIVPSEVNLEDATDKDLFEVALPTLTGTGGNIKYTLIVTNGTDLQVHTGQVEFAAANKGGTYTTQITDESVTDDANAFTGGAVLTENWSIVEGTDKITIRCNFNSDLSGTITMKLRYTLTNNSGQAVTLL